MGVLGGLSSFTTALSLGYRDWLVLFIVSVSGIHCGCGLSTVIVCGKVCVRLPWGLKNHNLGFCGLRGGGWLFFWFVWDGGHVGHFTDNDAVL